MSTPLAGRTILDCSALLPGPFAGKLLADLGARVIKVESPSRPDGARSMGSYYHELNDKKELAHLDLKTAKDRTHFEELVRNADGLLEGFRPEAKKRLGLDAKTLHAINPKLCIASLVGYPENGPWRDRAGHDMNFEAVTGALSMFNELPAVPLADFFAAYKAALALASMIAAADRGVLHQRVSVSMSEALQQALGIFIREFRETGQEPRYGATLMSGKFPCYRMYKAADGRRISVGAIEKTFWERFCRIVELPDLVEEGYATGERGRAAVAKIEAKLTSKPWKHWAPLFEKADCCVEPVLDFAEAYPRT